MSSRFAVIAAAGLILLVGGCKSASTTTASPGLLRAQPTILLSLGAGDSLGRRVYLNDLIIAAKAGNLDVAFSAVSDGSPIDLGE
ncbi:MAG: hypothetical protein HBSAPP03_11520 [Phycisphaerae bacterium]|nr:MAG: hypothetical protein HBSAPP03_11520 [Phycisphaerae bacterium]